jgi:serine protease Do
MSNVKIQMTNKAQSPKSKYIIAFVIAILLACLPAEASQRRSPVVIAVEKASPAVVNISTVVQERVSPFFPFGRDDFFKDFFPDFFSREYTRSSLGSGVIINGKKGYIITNHHVVARASEVKVITAEQEEYQAKILGTDPRSDLAVLQVEAGKTLPDIELGNSNDLMIGETVIAIGNPFGLSHTVTTGVISALERSVRGEERVYRHFIQTDASINPGNSGGPLLDIDGELIGINTAIYQKAQGIGFAIPINKAKRIVDELIRAGEVRPLWLGLVIQELSPELQAHFALSKDEKGVLVSDVVEGGPAGKAGLKRGDIILTVEGNPVPSPEDYRNVLADYTPGDRLRLEVFRQGRMSAVDVEPSAFPLEMALELVDRRLGISVGKPDSHTQQRYGIEGGVMIKDVRKGSEAGRIGLESGDLILKVNNETVANLDEFKKVISQYHHLPSLRLVVQRGAYAYSLTLPF